jgi:hypothetical protein
MPGIVSDLKNMKTKTLSAVDCEKRGEKLCEK